MLTTISLTAPASVHELTATHISILLLSSLDSHTWLLCRLTQTPSLYRYLYYFHSNGDRTRHFKTYSVFERLLLLLVKDIV